MTILLNQWGYPYEDYQKKEFVCGFKTKGHPYNETPSTQVKDKSTTKKEETSK